MIHDFKAPISLPLMSTTQFLASGHKERTEASILRIVSKLNIQMKIYKQEVRVTIRCIELLSASFGLWKSEPARGRVYTKNIT